MSRDFLQLNNKTFNSSIGERIFLKTDYGLSRVKYVATTPVNSCDQRVTKFVEVQLLEHEFVLGVYRCEGEKIYVDPRMLYVPFQQSSIPTH